MHNCQVHTCFLVFTTVFLSTTVNIVQSTAIIKTDHIICHMNDTPMIVKQHLVYAGLLTNE